MVHVLDCTLRDGGYYNSWDFEQNLIVDYLKSMSALFVDMVEIGFRLMPGTGDKFKGGCAYCTDDYICSLNTDNNRPGLAVMVNASDLLKYSGGVARSIDRLFIPAKESPLAMVRIACHVHQVSKTLPAISRLHEMGYKTTINLMQIAGLSYSEIKELSCLCTDYPIDILYFADSLGGMVQDDINYTVEALRSHWKGEMGFHAHNNMEWALPNCMRAIDQGVTWIDSTVLGMGRGPGNTRTEYLAIELEEKLGRKANLIPLLDLIDKYFKPLHKKYGWGPNPYYYMAGKHGIHPTYVQTMIDDSRFQNEDILAVVNYLKNKGGKHYNISNLKSARFFYSGQPKGEWTPQELVNNKTVMILGAGPGAIKYKHALENFIIKTKPIVIALNKQAPIEQHLINARAACHPIRLLADHEDHLALPQPLIMPASMLPNDVIALYRGKELFDYGISIQEDIFEFHQHYGILPNSLVITYVLSLLTSGKAKTIMLAGFDGYSPGDPRNSELDKMFSLYLSHKNSVPLMAVTPSKYQIPQTSIFELCADCTLSEQ